MSPTVRMAAVVTRSFSSTVLALLRRTSLAAFRMVISCWLSAGPKSGRRRASNRHRLSPVLVRVVVLVLGQGSCTAVRAACSESWAASTAAKTREGAIM